VLSPVPKGGKGTGRDSDGPSGAGFWFEEMGKLPRSGIGSGGFK